MSAISRFSTVARAQQAAPSQPSNFEQASRIGEQIIAEAVALGMDPTIEDLVRTNWETRLSEMDEDALARYLPEWAESARGSMKYVLLASAEQYPGFCERMGQTNNAPYRLARATLPLIREYVRLALTLSDEELRALNPQKNMMYLMSNYAQMIDPGPVPMWPAPVPGAISPAQANEKLRQRIGSGAIA
jgi:hypothetical protein